MGDLLKILGEAVADVKPFYPLQPREKLTPGQRRLAAVHAPMQAFTENVMEGVAMFPEVAGQVQEMTGLGTGKAMRGVAEAMRESVAMDERMMVDGEPMHEPGFGTEVAGAFGSATTFLAGGAGARALGLGVKGASRVVGGMGSMLQSQAMFREAEAAGADDATKANAFLWGAAICQLERVGNMEALGLGGRLAAINERSGGQVFELMTRAVSSGVKGGAGEALEEGLQTFSEKIVAQKILEYADEQDLEAFASDVFRASSIGAIVGQTMSGGVQLAEDMGTMKERAQRADLDAMTAAVTEEDAAEKAKEGDTALKSAAAAEAAPTAGPKTPEQAAETLKKANKVPEAAVRILGQAEEGVEVSEGEKALGDLLSLLRESRPDGSTIPEIALVDAGQELGSQGVAIGGAIALDATKVGEAMARVLLHEIQHISAPVGSDAFRATVDLAQQRFPALAQLKADKYVANFTKEKGFAPFQAIPEGPQRDAAIMDEAFAQGAEDFQPLVVELLKNKEFLASTEAPGTIRAIWDWLVSVVKRLPKGSRAQMAVDKFVATPLQEGASPEEILAFADAIRSVMESPSPAEFKKAAEAVEIAEVLAPEQRPVQPVAEKPKAKKRAPKKPKKADSQTTESKDVRSKEAEAEVSEDKSGKRLQKDPVAPRKKVTPREQFSKRKQAIIENPDSPFIHWLRAIGGVNDVGGDLESYTRKENPGLYKGVFGLPAIVRPKGGGLEADTIVRMMEEHGWIVDEFAEANNPIDTITDFIDRNPQRSDKDALSMEEEAQASKDDQYEAEVERLMALGHDRAHSEAVIASRTRDLSEGTKPFYDEFGEGRFSVAPREDSPAFRKWFGDSKVVGPDGKPLVVYHGGYGVDKLTAFDPDFGGQTTGNNEHGAFHFTDNLEVAEDYGRQSFIRRFQDSPEGLIEEGLATQEEVDGHEEAGDVYDWVEELAEENIHKQSTYLKIENPIEIDNEGEMVDVEFVERLSLFAKTGLDEEGDLHEKYFDLIFGGFDPALIEENRTEIEALARENEGLEEDEALEDYQFDEAAQEYLRDQGFEEDETPIDGVIIRNMVDSIGDMSNQLADQFVAFSPTQIKSVHNRGTFSATDPDIRFSVSDKDMLFRESKFTTIDEKGSGLQVAGASLFEEWLSDRQNSEEWAKSRSGLLERRLRELMGKRSVKETVGEAFRGDSLRKVRDMDLAMHLYIDLGVRAEEEFAEFGDKLTPKQKKIYELSQSLPKEIKAMADQIRAENNERGKELHDRGMIEAVIQDYTARIWKPLEEGGPIGGNAKFTTSSPRFKRRGYSSILEGWSRGRKLAVSSAITAQKMSRVQTAQVIHDLHMREYGLKSGVLSETQREGDVALEHPNFRKWVHAGEAVAGQVYGPDVRVDDNGVLFRKSEIYAQKKLATKLNNALGRGWDNPTINAITRVNAEIKAAILFTSFFHHQAFIRSYAYGVPKVESLRDLDPSKAYRLGREAIDNWTGEVEMLVRAGLTLDAGRDLAELEDADKTKIGKVIDKVAPVGAIKNAIFALRDQQTHFLFNRLGPYLKAQAAILEYRHLIKRNKAKIARGTVTLRELAEISANMANDDFGGMNLQKIGRNPKKQHLMRLMLLAPDWTESNVMSMVRAFKRGEEGHAYRAMWGRVAARAGFLTVVGNMLMAGWDDDENDPAGKDFFTRQQRAWKEGKLRYLETDITPLAKAMGGQTDRRYYFSVLGHFRDPLKFILHPMRSAKHKGSPIASAAIEGIMGTDWGGRAYTTVPELLGTDDKGLYQRSGTRPDGTKYKKGDPKGGKLKGQTITWTGRGGSLELTQVPSFAIARAAGSMPIQAQNLLGWSLGEVDGFSAMAKSMGLMVSSSRPVTPEEHVSKLESQFKNTNDKDLKREILAEIKLWKQIARESQ